MRSSPEYAPWQAGPFSNTSRIAAFALAAIVIDSAFLCQLATYRATTLAIGVSAALLTIRVIRVLPRSVESAAACLSLAAIWSTALLMTAAPGLSGQLVGGAVSLGLSLTGLSALIVGWSRERRANPVIALTRTSEHAVAVVRTH